MLPLLTPTLPRNADELRRALQESLRRVVNARGEIVQVRDRAFPALEEIAITLDNAEIRTNAPPPPRLTGTAVPALTTERFTVTARPLYIGDAAVALTLDASGVQLHEGRARGGEVVLLVRSARAGRLTVSATRSDLEALIAELARREAGRHGVTIEAVQLALRSAGPRSVQGEVQLRARKVFLSAVVRVTASVEIDDELTARLSGLSCHGEGAIGTLACGVLAPQLQKLESRSFELMALPLSEIRLHDVRVDVVDGIAAAAEFGTSSA